MKRKLLSTVSAFQNLYVKLDSRPSSLRSSPPPSPLETMWFGSRMKSLTLPFSVCLFFNCSDSLRVQQWNKMSGSGAESASMCWPAGSILMLPSTLCSTKGPLCALASQRCTPSSKKKPCPKTKPTAASQPGGPACSPTRRVQEEELPESEVTNKTWWISRRETEERSFPFELKRAHMVGFPSWTNLDGCAGAHVCLCKYFTVSAFYHVCMGRYSQSSSLLLMSLPQSAHSSWNIVVLNLSFWCPKHRDDE